MAKQTSLFGKISGKLGAVVFSTSGGETIAREYNPNVANPSTTAQVNQRARMKLMSQLSAALAHVIAMTKDGLTSKRNKFVKKNFSNSYATDGVAQISYENVQLTEGSLGLPQIVVAARAGDLEPYAALASGVSPNVSRVVYAVFQKSQENRLTFLKSYIATERTTEGYNFEFTVKLPDLNYQMSLDDDTVTFLSEYVIYAYGMIDTSERATAQYGNLQVQSASDIATLVGNRAISYEDYQFTQTRGVTIGYDSGGATPTPTGQARVFVTALGEGGTVSGGGTFALNSQVTVVATPNAQYRFRAWLKNGTSQVVSTSATYTFTLTSQVDLIATFDFQGNDTL